VGDSVGGGLDSVESRLSVSISFRMIMGGGDPRF